VSTLDPAATLADVLNGYTPTSAQERDDVERIRRLMGGGDPWSRSLPLHVTGSALVVHPETERVLLRWHARMQAWLQVGGHADPGETSPFAIALREAREETGLLDLRSWPDASRPELLQVAVVPVPAGKGEPPHEHADFRFTLATASPDAATPETKSAMLRWLSLDQAMSEVAEDNLRIALRRLAEYFGS
jgi:8-oxo-dGTP pyrophosphatase MutT (NUDIX family)